MNAPETRYAKTLDGLHIAYQVVGSGPFDLVYASSLITNLECVWEMPDQGDFLRRLAALFRLIVFDRRGVRPSLARARRAQARDSSRASRALPGTEVGTGGGDFFATFDGPARAVRGARSIVDALGLDVRTGLHTG